MSRKQIRHGQNDISIIGNLPQRLQMKFADKSTDGLENRCLEACKDEVDNTPYCEKSNLMLVNCNDSRGVVVEPYRCELQRGIPGILRLNNKNTSSEIRQSSERKKKMSNVQSTHLTGKCVVSTPVSMAIPGIIRLNDSDHARVAKGQRNKKDSSKLHKTETMPKVLKLKQVLHEEEITRDPSSLSPARSFVSRKYPIWFDDPQLKELCAELRELYDTLTGLMQQNAVLQHWEYLMEVRKKLQQLFRQIVLQHLKLCCEMKCDSFFWKLLFYNIREYLKYANAEQTSGFLLELIDDGIKFYEELIKCIKMKYLNKVPKSQVDTKQDAQIQKSEKFEFIATFVTQKLLICLGDLFRYKTIQIRSNDFNEAAKYYREAQILIPTNGIPYNQLAIVAIHDRKKFEAIYLHMRSLMSSNAIQSARESLLVLFDEIRKKFEKTEQKISPVHQYKNSNVSNSNSNCKVISPLRKEVWIQPGGVRRLHRTNVECRRKLNKPAKNVELRLEEMPVEDLQHRFISIYLYVIGKLYSGIGMETIQAHQTKLLAQLNALLKRNGVPLPITRSKILKMVALNIFILDYNMQQDSRREIRYYTFTFCNQMLGIILQKCNQMLKDLREFSDFEKLEEADGFKDLNTLLQFVKIYSDFLALNVAIWEPIRNEEQYFIDPWIELQTLFEHIEHILEEKREYLKTIPQHETEFILEENNFFYGFVPLKTLQSKRFLVKTCSSESIQFSARIAHIHQFQLCYSKNVDRLQAEDNDNNSSFVLEELNTDIKTALETLHDETPVASDDAEVENRVSNKSNLPKNKSLNDLKVLDETSDASVAQLTKLKKELEQQTNAKRLYNAKLEEILKYVDTKVYIEVRPKYLLPDTNCFIDCLDDFEKLLKNYKSYTLVVPSTVVRELDGLSKGVKLNSKVNSTQKHRIHHYDDVSTMAQRSLDFIKNAKQNVKCVTTKGSFLNASLFALVEEEYMSNDDRILATALALSKTMSRETSKDEKCFIQTELVLITTDRNLRVKALSRNLAVSELGEFLLWAQDCNNHA